MGLFPHISLKIDPKGLGTSCGKYSLETKYFGDSAPGMVFKYVSL